ncbi:hypothetical protein PNA2_1788 [Pyrococcus sp. NA2]|uniref:DUF7424 family protein n=1 Tax=Pyrococcus sp. (strain NA2) TaxID=342949 RepID=UPI000209ABA5|nr:hypothetical protein [Pyrococcus sp. NA2]AEC52704.1 hypothetical protein PNA2_1788 [Pyrococcus sp. NA2]
MRKTFLVPLFLLFGTIIIAAMYFVVGNLMIGDVKNLEVKFINVTVSKLELDHAVLDVSVKIKNPVDKDVRVDILRFSLYMNGTYMGDVNLENVTLKPGQEIELTLNYTVTYSSLDVKLLKVIVENRTSAVSWNLVCRFGVNTPIGEIGKSLNLTLESS